MTYNIEHSLRLSTHIAQIGLNENFQTLRDESYSDTAVLFYTNCGNNTGEELFSYSLKGKKENFKAFLSNLFYDEQLKGLKKDELEDMVRDYLDNEYDDFDFEAKQEAAAEYGIKLTYERELMRHVSRGYCQGDCAHVIIDLTSYKGGILDLKNHIDKLLWDIPIVGSVAINNSGYGYRGNLK